MLPRFVLPSLFLTVAVNCVSATDQSSSAAVIVTPEPGQAVMTQDQVTVRMRSGVPIVAIRSQEKGSKWWIQRPAERIDEESFVIKSRFGNAKTIPGTKFEIAVMRAPDEQEAESVDFAKPLDTLPADNPLLETRLVILGRPKPVPQTPTTPSDLHVEMISPRPGGEVIRLQDIVVRFAEDDEEAPCLVVRSDAVNESWWVQDRLEKADDGTFTGVARIGNEKTATGSKFLLMFVTPKDDVSRATLAPGTALKDLSGYRCSEPLTVRRISRTDEATEAAIPLASRR